MAATTNTTGTMNPNIFMKQARPTNITTATYTKHQLQINRQ